MISTEATPATSYLARPAAALAALSGWRRHAVAALCGVLVSAALPPLHLLPLLVPAFTGLLWLLDGAARRREAALIGWSFGFGHMISGLYWIGIAFLVDPDRYGLMMPFALIGLTAGLAVFPALAIWITAVLGRRGPARILILTAAWLAVEWLRGSVLTGFPWNLLGTAWSFSPAMLQVTAVTGVWGLSAITVLAAATPAVLAGPDAALFRRRGLFAAVLLLLPAFVWAGGALRLAAAPPVGSDRVEGVVLRLVQPSIEQALKWKRELRQGHVRKQISLSTAPASAPISHVIWAETAVPFLVDQEPELRRDLTRAVPDGGLLIAGAPRNVIEAGEPRLWNSLHALDGEGRIVGTYDKFHLVPFGEYMPLRSLLRLAKLTAGSTDFSPGPGLVTLDLPGLPPVSPLICYEVIFPGRVVAEERRPEWLLNVTNDAWFGNSSGPYQHFASARLRSVEQGLPLVRVANNGISGVIDAYGRIVGRLGLNQAGVLDVPLTRPVPGITWYARLGDGILLVMLVILGFSALMCRRFMA